MQAGFFGFLRHGAKTKNPRIPAGPFWKIGAGDEIRTHDPNLGKVMLYP